VIAVRGKPLSAYSVEVVTGWAGDPACLRGPEFSGAGYLNEYEITRLWRDTRVQRILAGSSEVMRHIVGRSMRLDR
jgi:alkylation response protein AidB-like acyl-CoA dehydrogenase